MSATSCELAVWTSRCSGASLSEIATHSSMLPQTTEKDCFRASFAVDRFGSGSESTWLETCPLTLSTMPASSVTSIARATTSCSACAMRSAATTSASAVPSQITRTSDGPASMSIPQYPLTIDLAAVTHLFPGPTMTSHGGTAGTSSPFNLWGGTPYAMAPTACAPPTHRTRSAPATCAAARVMGAGRGEARTTWGQPAARAVTTVMRTEEGRGYRPPGA
mmetsp:Transcript_32243/g.73130  ORF Transcript_32243/g.73130 Transcript_32243/m.73130 type:complete len:220 (-) Transcript_32243:423-1082(-)